MKLKVLTEQESYDLIDTYFQLRDLIDTVHTEAVLVLENKYQQYLQNFKPKVLWIFTRTPLTFEQFISGINFIGNVYIETFNSKKYLQLAYFYSPKSIHNVLNLSDSEKVLIEAAFNYGLDIYKTHNKYINRLINYAAKPLELENSDLDNFDKYKLWYKELKESWDTYNNIP